MIRSISILCAILTIQGCASSHVFSDNKSNTEVVANYNLPRAYFPAEISVDDDGKISFIFLNDGKVSLIPDGNITLRYNPSAFSDDTIKVSVNSQGFLENATVDVDDKSSTFIEEIAKTAISGVKAVSAFPSSGGKKEKLYVNIDPYVTQKKHIGTVNGKNIYMLTESLTKAEAKTAHAIRTVPSCTYEICTPILEARKISMFLDNDAIPFVNKIVGPVLK